ncbi:hypothetical protein C8J57DRAFT_1291922 [Mycena rebaudengoi]|nr:hypothetical protein C8J57DRAFT_1291922 [Mycena rebaudengoi]
MSLLLCLRNMLKILRLRFDLLSSSSNLTRPTTMIDVDRKIDVTKEPTTDVIAPPKYVPVDPKSNYVGISEDGAVTDGMTTEEEWQRQLQRLQRRIRKYNWTKRGDEQAIADDMRGLATRHTDPRVQAYWNQRADEFEKAPEADKMALLADVARGLAILIAAPFAIAGGILVAVGSMLKASSNFLIGNRASSSTGATTRGRK